MSAMIGEAPAFWWQDRNWRAYALAPVGFLYGRVARARMQRGARRAVDRPVLCVGNFTVGGSGKTPTVLALAQTALDLGLTPGILSRGYGGRLAGPVIVDADRHRASDVGDEPLLHAGVATTCVAKDRPAGAEHLIAHGVDFIIMDDGFQSARLKYDLALLVIDARRALGNGAVLPAGPVRAPVADQIRHASALLRMGTGTGADPVVRLMERAGKPTHDGRLVPLARTDLKAIACLAYTGIGDPGKFFLTLGSIGADVQERRTFRDHHDYDESDAQELLATAAAKDLRLVTTAKDHVRLARQTGALAQLAMHSDVVEIRLCFDDPGVPARLIEQTIDRCRQRRMS